MTADELSEKFAIEFTSIIDSTTLKEGISRRDTARIYREIAGEFRSRASGLEEEADVEGE